MTKKTTNKNTNKNDDTKDVPQSTLAKLAPVDVSINPTVLTFDKQDVVNIGIVELEERITVEYNNRINELKDVLKSIDTLARNANFDEDGDWEDCLDQDFHDDFLNQINHVIYNTQVMCGARGGFGFGNGQQSKASMASARSALGKKVKGVVDKFGLDPKTTKISYSAFMNYNPDQAGMKGYDKDKLRPVFLSLQLKSTDPGDYRRQNSAIVSGISCFSPQLSFLADTKGVPQLLANAQVASNGDGYNVSCAFYDFAPMPKEWAAKIHELEQLYATAQNLDDQIMELHKLLKDIPKLERKMKAAVAQKVLGDSETGRALLDTMRAYNAKALMAPAPVKK